MRSALGDCVEVGGLGRGCPEAHADLSSGVTRRDGVKLLVAGHRLLTGPRVGVAGDVPRKSDLVATKAGDIEARDQRGWTTTGRQRDPGTSGLIAA